MAEPLRAAIIGCGAVGGGYDEHHGGDMILSHAGAYRRHDGFALTVCVEPDAARRQAFMRHWKIANGFASIDEWRGSGVGCDVASLCTPSADHAGALMQLLEMPLRGVFCEKPVATNRADGETVVAAYRDAGRPLQVNYSRRWDPEMSTLKQRIADGGWGRIYGASGFYSKGLLNNGSHLVDLVCFLLGTARVACVTRNRSGPGDDDPRLDLLLDCSAEPYPDDTVPVHLIGGDARDYALFELRIAAENGIVDIEDSGFSIRERRPEASAIYDGYMQLARGSVRDTGLKTAALNAADNLYCAITRGEPMASDGRSALATLGICDEALHRATIRESKGMQT